MTRVQLSITLFTTFLVFCTLYTPQPILPQLVLEFGVAKTEAALLMTATLLPLGLAPVFYGYFLQAVPARTMLRIALALLIADQLLLFISTEFWHLLTLRFIQGLLMPALFTSLMTYCATMSSKDKVRATMGLYVAATIVGGFLSRALSGYLSATIGWQWVFLVLAMALLIPLWLTAKIDADAEINFARLDAKAVSRVLQVPDYAFSYLALATIFITLTGILSLLPFRIDEIAAGASSFTISMVYTGYMIGIPMAIMSDQISLKVGGVKNALLIGLGLIIIGMVFYLIPSVPILFTFMIAHAGGFFLIHSTLSGYLNHIALEHKGVVNGIYVSVYYLSATLGSWLPFLLYQHLGWQPMIYLFIAILFSAILFILKLRQQ